MERRSIPTTTARRRRLLALCSVVLVVCSGCVSGHRVLRASHARQNDAVHDRAREELLLNLVRLRYRDTPLFLRIGSIVAQFQFSASAGASASVNEDGPDAVGLQGGVGFSEQPTYTFTPLQDDDFVQRLLTPIGLDVVLLLQRSGWSVDRVLRLTVQEISGLDNATSASGPTPRRAPLYREFQQVTTALRSLQADRALSLGYEPRDAELSAAVPLAAIDGAALVAAAEQGYRFEKIADGEQMVLVGSGSAPVMRLATAALQRAEVRRLVDLLGLQSGRTRYELVAAEAGMQESLQPPGSRTSITLGTRSLLGALFYLSHGIDIPEPHVEQGLVTVTLDDAGREFDWRELIGELLHVRSSKTVPQTAAVRVPYRGYWFYIDDRDLDSKSTFSLLTQLFSLQSGTAVGNTPVLTLPVGG